MRLLAILRIAVILERSHADAHSPAAQLRVAGDQWLLDLPPGWLAEHPLSERELAEEIKQLRAAQLDLQLRPQP